MDKTRLMRQLRKEAFHVKKKMGKIKDPRTKQRMKRSYSQLIGVATEISKA